ncbi:DUF6504 family protein [Pseudarthrobacter sp. YS3]|uniref:DUF6504 family protein n=1 Tax=Pseudarthrobacter sp. YS3 TaxID=3453718 RepID=UPI003EE9D19F
MGMFSESVDVLCTPAGQPLELRWAGRHYMVCAEPSRWYERRQWWAEESRAPLGSGPGLVDHEIWRVQVRDDTRTGVTGDGGPGDGGQPLTLDLTRHIGSGRWRLLRIHDALQPKTA